MVGVEGSNRPGGEGSSDDGERDFGGYDLMRRAGKRRSTGVAGFPERGV